MILTKCTHVQMTVCIRRAIVQYEGRSLYVFTLAQDACTLAPVDAKQLEIGPTCHRYRLPHVLSFSAFSVCATFGHKGKEVLGRSRVFENALLSCLVFESFKRVREVVKGRLLIEQRGRAALWPTARCMGSKSRSRKTRRRFTTSRFHVMELNGLVWRWRCGPEQVSFLFTHLSTTSVAELQSLFSIICRTWIPKPENMYIPC